MGLFIRKLIGKFYKGNEWKDLEYFDEKWKNRIHQMSEFISSTDSVVDYGCGKMWLRDYLSPQNMYYGVDYQSRGAGTIVCDFNSKQFPNIKSDIAFISGCLEYIDDPKWFLENISNYHEKCVISYCCLDNFGDFVSRKKLGWKNNFSKFELISLFESYRMTLKKNEITQTKNDIFYFEKNNPK